jgi:rSAM/selenodomain-associated transferase 2
MSAPSSSLFPLRSSLISVVIPALDEEAALPAALASVAAQAGPVEVVVVDGGSADRTRAVAEAAGVRVLIAPRGRARQMNAGASATAGEALLFLHADTCLPAGALAAVRTALADPAVAGGCFRTTFDDTRSVWMRVWQGRLWMRWHRLAFGDRAPFARRAAFEAAGGFPDQPIFEDLELVRRLRRAGRFVFLDAAVVTSARRFRANGPVLQQARNAALWAAWNLRLPARWFARFYPDGPASGRDTPAA